MYKLDPEIWLKPMSFRLICLKAAKEFLTKLNSLSEAILIINATSDSLVEKENYLELS